MTKRDPQEDNVKGMIAGAVIFGMSVVVLITYFMGPIDETTALISLLGCPLSIAYFYTHSKAYDKWLNAEVKA